MSFLNFHLYSLALQNQRVLSHRCYLRQSPCGEWTRNLWSTEPQLLILHLTRSQYTVYVRWNRRSAETHHRDAAELHVQFSSSGHTAVWSHLCFLWQQTFRWLLQLIWMLCGRDVWSLPWLSTPAWQTNIKVSKIDSLKGKTVTNAFKSKCYTVYHPTPLNTSSYPVALCINPSDSSVSAREHKIQV